MNAIKFIVTKAMLQLGFMPNYNGFMFLRSAVMLALKEPEALTLITKLIYVPLGKEYSTTAVNIEKSIRTAADAAWSRCAEPGKTVSVLGGTYTYSDRRPGNRELISLIAGFVKESGEIFDTDAGKGI